ncbi:MAG: ADP/ATP-dependent (S)-NAD(P)H-hydrate dehydratase, partial [Pseudomonadota bacterium]|nr:ADP/ATP-dependent (S)-NAD(P)H-hydrate dehydratase [Pseudomonadota bacterium]
EDFIKALECSKADVIITPHEGEFNKIFGDLKGSKIERTKSAAIKSKSTVILKGNDTVVASPDGEVIISDKTSPFLATAGSGDVLSGICGGLTAQGMKSFKAACAAQWIHSSIGLIAGPGLIAEDMISIIKDDIPDILMRIYTK